MQFIYLTIFFATPCNFILIYQQIHANDTEAVIQTFDYLLPTFNYSVKVVAVINDTDGPGEFLPVVTGMSWIFFNGIQAFITLTVHDNHFHAIQCSWIIELLHCYLSTDPLPKVNYRVISTPTNITVSIPVQEEFISEFSIDFGNQSIVCA